jgi:predicted Zn-dependent protease
MPAPDSTMTDSQLQNRGASQGKSKTKDFWQLASRAYSAAFKGQWRRAYPLLRELAPQKPDNVSLRRWLAETELRLGLYADALESWRSVLRLQEEPAKLHKKLFRQAFRERVKALAETDLGQARGLCQQARREFEADLGERETALVRRILGEGQAPSETALSRRLRPPSDTRDEGIGKFRPPDLTPDPR